MSLVVKVSDAVSFSKRAASCVKHDSLHLYISEVYIKVYLSLKKNLKYVLSSTVDLRTVKRFWVGLQKPPQKTILYPFKSKTISLCLYIKYTN